MSDKKRGSILIVDDNADQVLATTELLQLEGFTVQGARDGEQALSALASARFDCVVTDLFMPEMDGIELIAEIKRRFPEMKSVAISGCNIGRTDYLNAVTHIGADATLRKPVDHDMLVATLNKLLGIAT